MIPLRLFQLVSAYLPRRLTLSRNMLFVQGFSIIACFIGIGIPWAGKPDQDAAATSGFRFIAVSSVSFYWLISIIYFFFFYSLRHTYKRIVELENRDKPSREDEKLLAQHVETEMQPTVAESSAARRPDPRATLARPKDPSPPVSLSSTRFSDSSSHLAGMEFYWFRWRF